MPLKPLLQESTRENWASRSPDGSGAVSLLTMVPVAAPSAMVAPEAPARLMVKVSLPSTAVSPVIGTVTVLVVSPAAKVRVPDRAV